MLLIISQPRSQGLLSYRLPEADGKMRDPGNDILEKEIRAAQINVTLPSFSEVN